LKKLNYKKLIIFDLDGVLIDSKKNMLSAWSLTNKNFALRISFDKYFSLIGRPFEEILKQLGIKKKIKLIKKSFSKESIKNFHKIKLYKNIRNLLNILKKKEFRIAIVTSKEKKRTIKLLDYFKIKVDFLQCPSKYLRGKPYPDQLLKAVSFFKLKKKDCVYIGDTISDLKAAQRAKIDFIFAKYGYKIGIKKFYYSINNPIDLLKI
jgi:HAD superfamily hydrolase (TIGR01509 family)